MSLQAAIDCTYSVPDTALMAVKTCSKAISTYSLGHGKSPCFLQIAFLKLISPDYPLLVLPCIDGQKFLECTF